MFQPSKPLPGDNPHAGDTGHVEAHDMLRDALDEARQRIPSTAADVGAVDAAGAVSAVGGRLWFGTMAQFNAVATKSATTAYFIIG